MCSVSPPVEPLVAPLSCAPTSSAPASPPVFTILDGNRWCVDVSFPDGPPAAPGADLGVSGPPSGPSVSAGVHRPVFAFHHVVGFGALVLCVGGNGIIHSAHKAIQGDDCRPRRSSRLRFPWLTPIRNSFELRCLYRLRSYFGPRTCGRGITNSSKHRGALNQGFPFSLLQCRQDRAPT